MIGGIYMDKNCTFLRTAFTVMISCLIFVGCPLGSDNDDPPDVPAASSAKAFTSFGIVSPAASGLINETSHTIAVTLPPHGSGVTALTATFAATGTAVRVGTVPQVSGTTQNDFTNPVVYTVAAEDGTTQDYVVTVSPQSLYVVGETADGSGIYVPCLWVNGTRTDLSKLSEAKSGYARFVGFSGGDLYIAGYTTNDTNITRACYWKNGLRTDLPSPNVPDSSGMNAAVIANGDIYICGGIAGSDGFGTACYWKNAEIVLLTKTDGTQTIAESIFVDGSDVYVTGRTVSVGPCYWKNGARTDLSAISETYLTGESFSIVLSGGNVYIAGFTRNDLNQSIACFWKDGLRTDLPTGSSTNVFGYARSVSVAGTTVYVSGYTLNDSGKEVPCYWENGTLHLLEMLSPLGTATGRAYRNLVYNSDAYTLGYTESETSWQVPCYWKNGTRTDLPRISSSQNGFVLDLACSGDNVFASGGTDNESGVTVPCYWQNGDRTDLAVLDPAQDGTAEALGVW
jgi:hypothetical protein